MRLLTRYLTREILAYVAGIFLLILGVFLVRRSALLLAELTEAAVPIGVIAKLLGLRTLMALPSLLPSVVYLAVLLALIRLNDNNELDALQACGISRARLYRSVAPLALAATVVIGLLAIYGRPWAATRYLQTKADATAAAGTDQMRPGRFYELDLGEESVFFAERRSAADPRFLEDVFLQQRDGRVLSIHFAARAFEQLDAMHQNRLVGLFDGRRYDFPFDSDKHSIIEYSDLTMAFPLPAATITIAEEEMSVADLWRSPLPADSAELQWRLAMPLSTLVLILLALPLSPERHRASIGARMFVALLTYVTYRQMLGTGKGWIADGTLPPLPGTLPVHGLFFAIAVALLVRQSVRAHGGWLPLVTRPRPAAPPARAGGGP